MIPKKLGDLRIFVSSQGVEATNAKLGMTEKKATMASKAAGMLKTALLGIGAYAIIRGLKSVITQFTDYTVKIDKFVKQTGMAADTIQELVYAAEQEHSSLEALNKGLMNLTVRLGYAGDGLETYLRYFRALDIEYQEADGTLRDTYDVFLDIADAVEKGTLSTEELAAVLQLFGARSGKELIPLLKKGKHWFKEMGNEAKQLGIVLENKTIKQGKAFSDQMTKMKGATQGLTYAIAKDLLPAFADLVNFATELIKSLTDWKWLIPSITEAIIGQVPKVNELTKAYAKLDKELQEIIEREGKYSIEVMAKLLELDEKLRQEELKLIGGLQTLGEARNEYNADLSQTKYLTPLVLSVVQDLTNLGLIPESEILGKTKKKREEDNKERQESINITNTMLEQYRLWLGIDEERAKLMWKLGELTEEETQHKKDIIAMNPELEENRRQYIETTKLQIDTGEMFLSLMNDGLMPAFMNIDQVLLDSSYSWADWGKNIVKSLVAVGIQLLALAAIIKFLEMLGVPAGALISAGSKIGLFQTPTGDAFAAREGRDFGKMFFDGFSEQMNGMLQGINVNQPPVNVIVHTGDPSTFVEFVSEMPNAHKSKFYREVTEKARLLES